MSLPCLNPSCYSHFPSSKMNPRLRSRPSRPLSFPRSQPRARYSSPTAACGARPPPGWFKVLPPSATQGTRMSHHTPRLPAAPSTCLVVGSVLPTAGPLAPSRHPAPPEVKGLQRRVGQGNDVQITRHGICRERLAVARGDVCPPQALVRRLPAGWSPGAVSCFL